MDPLTLQQIANQLDGCVKGNPEHLINGINSLEDAQETELSFFADPQFKRDFEKTGAGAVLVSPDTEANHVNLIQVKNPGESFDFLVNQWLPLPESPVSGVHPTAIVPSSVKIGEGVSVGPYCVVGENCSLGDNSILMPHVVISENVTLGDQTTLGSFVCIRESCRVGNRCLIHPGVVIGFDGFGFNLVKGKWIKIPQRGIVVIEDDVEIGANATIARARFGQTRIGAGTKIDADTHVGHNVQIGRHVYVGAMSGFAGTTKIGDHCVVAPQVGIAPQAKVPARTTLAARTVVTKTLSQSGIYMGFPAIDHQEEKRRYLATRRLPQLQEEIKNLRKRLEKLEQSTNH